MQSDASFKLFILMRYMDSQKYGHDQPALLKIETEIKTYVFRLTGAEAGLPFLRCEVELVLSDLGVAGSHKLGSAMNLESILGFLAPELGLPDPCLAGAKVADIGLRLDIP